MAEFVVMQDMVRQITMTGGEFQYNHGPGSPTAFVANGTNPSYVTKRGFAEPDGTVLAWGDGSARYVHFKELVNVGSHHRSVNRPLYSLPPGQ